MPLWNSVTSRENASKAVAARRRNRQARIDREALLERLLKAESEKLVQAAENPPIKPDAQDDDYVVRRLQRVRNQIEQVEAMLEGAAVASEVDRLASAIARLSELERLYAGRPLPGSKRPPADRSKPLYAFTAPTDS